MFDWIAIGFGVSLGAFLFALSVVVGLIVLFVVGMVSWGLWQKLREHNDRIRRRHENEWSRCEGRWDSIANENRRLVREAQIARVRPLLTPVKPRMTDEERRRYYGDPDENLRLHRPGATVSRGGIYRP